MIVGAAEAIAEEARSFDPHGKVVTIENGSDFDDFAGLERHPSDRFRLTHTGSFFGKRDPRPFLTALKQAGVDDVVARFLGDFREADRAWAAELQLGDRLELLPYAPRVESLALQRDSEALLLLIPEAGGRGKGVLSGKVFEYIAVGRPILAAVPPDGAAAELRVAAIAVVHETLSRQIDETVEFDEVTDRYEHVWFGGREAAQDDSRAVASADQRLLEQQA